MPRRAVAPRFVTGRVIDGRIVTRARLRDGSKLRIQIDEPPPPIELDAEDDAVIARARAEIRAGRGIPLPQFLAKLRRL